MTDIAEQRFYRIIGEIAQELRRDVPQEVTEDPSIANVQLERELATARAQIAQLTDELEAAQKRMRSSWMDGFDLGIAQEKTRRGVE